jgi:hypothetical protein
MKWIYAILCLLGFALPYYFFVQFVQAHGLDLKTFFDHLFANNVSGFFALDVFVSALVLWAFIFHETRKRPVRLSWLCVVASLTVGVSLGLPLFLLLREIEDESARLNQTKGSLE